MELAKTVSKVVQNIANGITDGREDMLPLKEFIAARIEKNGALMEFMAAERPQEADMSFLEVGWDAQDELTQSMVKLSEFVVVQADVFTGHAKLASPTQAETELKRDLAAAVVPIVEVAQVMATAMNGNVNKEIPKEVQHDEKKKDPNTC